MSGAQATEVIRSHGGCGAISPDSQHACIKDIDHDGLHGWETTDDGYTPMEVLRATINLLPPGDPQIHADAEWALDHFAALEARAVAAERERDEERERFHRHVEEMIEPRLLERLAECQELRRLDAEEFKAAEARLKDATDALREIEALVPKNRNGTADSYDGAANQSILAVVQGFRVEKMVQ